ncbi:60S ribosome subunit biogenesis protein NIP7-like protein, partial [Acropora cervicornis]
ILRSRSYILSTNFFSARIGDKIKLLIDRPDGNYCFRLHEERVYYISEEIMEKATNVGRDILISVETCIGKVTKTRKFRLYIPALDFMDSHAKVQCCRFILVL